MSQDADVLIVGGGIVGLSAALVMAQRNYSVALIDAGSLYIDVSVIDKRVYAINKSSESLFNALEVWQHLDKKRLSPYGQMHIWDALTGASIDFDSRIIADYHLGTIIEESILKQALIKQVLSEPGISLFFNCCIDTITELDQGISVCSKDKMWQGKLLMVADGANSQTRQKLQVELTTWSYQQHALVATVRTEKPHSQTAYQIFNKDGPLAFLPLSDEHQCSIVWSTDPERVRQLITLNHQEFNEELACAFEKKLGQVELIGERYQFPLLMRHATRYVGRHWMLLGDAAHTIHPLAGLGLNVGLGDLASWIHYLDYNQGMNITPKMLGAYQRERKHAVWQTIMLMEGLKRLFGSSLKPVIGLRGLGLRVCNELNAIKRFCIQQAEG